ncbi:U4/U6.U5 tri-snRNP-associated protein 1 [Onthophagus taurus]|uniref:U4/U6.U5 tri-snRNP-associated protein 1 n=1 Tax=Onthophagus taurus TaxID=166361 RepID=UPI000C205113|nr:U4/U6.U5 tri-snRNP-associated protein 1 [Onthophagus taurus]
MGSSSKKYKEKDANNKKRKQSPSRSDSEEYDRDRHRDRKHKHRRHHKDKKRHKHHDYESHDSDVIEVSPDRAPSPKRDKTPEQSGQSQESLSIQESNKIRAQLGLKPLEVNKADDKPKADGKKKDDWGEFYHKPAGNISQKNQQEKIKTKLAEHKEKRLIATKLSKIKPLGESDSDDNASNWVDRSRKIEQAKKDAENRAKLLQELDEQFGVTDIIESETKGRRQQQYSEKHLKGLTVEHDINEIAEERSVILTLKDNNVLDEKDDVLVNVNMVDNERYKKNVENLKKKPQYNAYDVEEFDEFGNPIEKSLLDKYDVEIDGEKKQSFRIGHDNYLERKHAAMESVKNKLANKKLESLQGPGLTLASEYYNEEELTKFKKPKKKKVRKIREKGKLTADYLEQIQDEENKKDVKKIEEMDIDDIPDIKLQPDQLKYEEKDDAFNRAIKKTRLMKDKEKLIDVISALKAIKDEPIESSQIDTGHIILNSTAEFCRTLGDIPTYGRAGNRDQDIVEEDLLDFEGGDAGGNKSDDDCQIISDDEGGRWNSVDLNEHRHSELKQSEVPILDEEPDVGTGVGAALKLAMSKGYLDKEQNNRPSNTRLAHLQAKHYSIEDKTYGDDIERGGRRERYTGPVSEFKEKDTFKPNVKLEYIDDEGRVLNSKEAFRYLSHKFHGKGPGKNKIEKRLKKQQQEGLMKKMSSTDTPLGTLNMLQAKQKEMQSPYIVLSGGKHTHSTTISKQSRR